MSERTMLSSEEVTTGNVPVSSPSHPYPSIPLQQHSHSTLQPEPLVTQNASATSDPSVPTHGLHPYIPVPPPAGAPRNDSSQGSVKRKWNPRLNLALMREVSGAGAHIPPRNEVRQRFTDVANRLNGNADLQLPWKTDGKHCRDRFKLLMEKWELHDRDAARASGGGELFGEY